MRKRRLKRFLAYMDRLNYRLGRKMVDPLCKRLFFYEPFRKKSRIKPVTTVRTVIPEGYNDRDFNGWATNIRKQLVLS